MSVSSREYLQPVPVYKTMNYEAAYYLSIKMPKMEIIFQIEGKDILTIPNEIIYDKLEKWAWSVSTCQYLLPEQLDKVTAILRVNDVDYTFKVERKSGLKMVNGTYIGNIEARLCLNQGEWKPELEVQVNHEY